MASENHSKSKFEEALELLNEAAREKKEEIESLIADKYEHLSEAFGSSVKRNRKNFNRVKDFTEEDFFENTEKFQDMAAELDEKIRKNPWPYVGGAALAALLFGLLVGSGKK